MMLIGVACAAIAAGALCVAARRGTAVQRRLALLAPVVGGRLRWRPVDDRDLRQARMMRTHRELIAGKVIGLAAGALTGAVVGGFVGAGVIASSVCAYAGWLGPSLAVERRAAARRREARLALGPFLERLDALASAGRPVEAAVIALRRARTRSGRRCSHPSARRRSPRICRLWLTSRRPWSALAISARGR